MKRRVVYYVLCLIICVTACIEFVSCGNNEQNKANPIIFTDDMTFEDIINILPQIESLTIENMLDKSDVEVKFCANKNGYIQTFTEKDGSVTTYLMYANEDKYVCIYYDPNNFSDSYKEEHLINKENPEYNLLDYVNQIQIDLNDSLQWGIKEGKLVITTTYGAKIFYSDINSTVIDFNYYLQLDIIEYSEEEYYCK